MKTISFDANKAADSKALLKNTIGSAPEQGYTIEQVRQGIKIIDKIEVSEGEKIILEDAEYTFVRERVDAIKWTIANQDIVAFYDAILGAQ